MEEFRSLTASAYSTLDAIDRVNFDSNTLSRIDAMRTELARAESLATTAAQTGKLGDILAATGKLRGIAAASLDIISQAVSPQGTYSGMIGATLATLFSIIAAAAVPISGLPTGVFSITVGTIITSVAKVMWDNVAEALGISQDSPLGMPHGGLPGIV